VIIVIEASKRRMSNQYSIAIAVHKLMHGLTLLNEKNENGTSEIKTPMKPVRTLGSINHDDGEVIHEKKDARRGSD
jgi:hypothetical protein